MAPSLVPICVSRARHPHKDARLDAGVRSSRQQSPELSRYRCPELDSAMLESAVQLRCPVASASIAYALDDGSAPDEVCYWRDMTLVPHLLNLLFKRQIYASYSFSAAAVRAGNRKEMAKELRDEIVAMRS